MSKSSGRLVGKMKWLVTRYPLPVGQLIALGAILSDPEEPESRLNLNHAKVIDENEILNQTTAVQRTIEAEVSNDDSILLKVAHPLLGAGMSAGGKLTRDRKTVVDALDVKAKIFIPTSEYVEGSISAPGVQAFVKDGNFSKRLYMIVGVASAKKLSIDEETSQQGSFGASFTAAQPGGHSPAVTGEVQHAGSKKAASGLKIEEECDFAYRIREFTYWKHRAHKTNLKGDRTEGALFGMGDYDEEGDDDEDEDEEFVAVFKDFGDDDVDSVDSSSTVPSMFEIS